jgi:hypothetical protein
LEYSTPFNSVPDYQQKIQFQAEEQGFSQIVDFQSNNPGDFVVANSVNAIPEPASLLAWSGLGAMVLIACVWRRRKRNT